MLLNCRLCVSFDGCLVAGILFVFCKLSLNYQEVKDDMNQYLSLEKMYTSVGLCYLRLLQR